MGLEQEAPRNTLPRQSYTMAEAMAATGWNRNRLYSVIAQGRLKTFKVGRCRFVTPKALTECIAQMEREAQPKRGVR